MRIFILIFTIALFAAGCDLIAPPVPELTAKITEQCSGVCKPLAEGMLEVYVPTVIAFSAESEGATSFTWDFGDGTTAATKSAIHEYKETGPTTVTLTVRDDADNETAAKLLLLKLSASAEIPSAEDGLLKLFVQVSPEHVSKGKIGTGNDAILTVTFAPKDPDVYVISWEATSLDSGVCFRSCPSKVLGNNEINVDLWKSPQSYTVPLLLTNLGEHSIQVKAKAVKRLRDDQGNLTGKDLGGDTLTVVVKVTGEP